MDMKDVVNEERTRDSEVPVTIERDGDRVTVFADSFGDVSERFPDAVNELRKIPERSFRLEGGIALYRGWTVQPREVCESWLEGPGEGTGVRALLIIRDPLHLGERDLADTDLAERAGILNRMVRDSEHIQKRTAGNSDEVVPANDSIKEAHRAEIATDVLYTCGYLDLEGVEARLADMRRRIGERDGTIEELRTRVERADEERGADGPLVELGRSCVEGWRREAVSRLRAIGITRGGAGENDPRLRILEDPETNPDTIRELHRRITDEFRALYPTEPVSVASRGNSSGRVRWDWDAYRI